MRWLHVVCATLLPCAAASSASGAGDVCAASAAHAERSGTPPRRIARWGDWVPPDAAELREFELGFSQAIADNSHLLKADPTSRGAYQGGCDLSHTRRCTWCPVQARAHAQARNGSAALFAHGVETMLDDRPLHAWRNAERVLAKPRTHELRGVKQLDFYCSAFFDGGAFVITHRKQTLHSTDGITFQKRGRPRLSPDGGFDTCLSRVDDGKGAPVWVAGGDGAVWCGGRQPSLYALERSADGGFSGRVARHGAPPPTARAARMPNCPGSVRSRRPPAWGQLATNRSLIPAGGDACTHVFHSAARRADVVSTRANFCALDAIGQQHWRQIRGVHLRETPSVRLLSKTQLPASEFWVPRLSAYFDLESKADHYRMQAYALYAAPYPAPAVPAAAPPEGEGDALIVGVQVVLNYAKAADMPLFARNCSAVRGGAALCDTADAYLVTSRDGIHFDAGWVYARQPLVQRGTRRSDPDGGIITPCGAPVFANGQTWLFYAGYPGSHEKRGKPTAYGARWPMHALVALEPANASEPAQVWIREFELELGGGAALSAVDVLVGRTDAAAGGAAAGGVPAAGVVQLSLEHVSGMADLPCGAVLDRVTHTLAPLARPIAAGEARSGLQDEGDADSPCTVRVGALSAHRSTPHAAATVRVRLHVRLERARIYALARASMAAGVRSTSAAAKKASAAHHAGKPSHDRGRDASTAFGVRVGHSRAHPLAPHAACAER